MNMTELFPWAVFGSCFCAAWAALSHFAGKAPLGLDRASERLKDLRGNGAERQPSAETALQKVAVNLSQWLRPRSELEQNALKVRLANAGFNSQHASSLFLAIKLAVIVAGGIIGAGGGLAVWGLAQRGLTAPVIVGGIAFFIPDMVLAYLISARKERLFLTLPSALDMLVCCVEVGLGLDIAFKRIVQHLKDTAPDLCAEMALYNFQIQMGRPRNEALHDMAVRGGVDDLSALTSMLIQADRFGSSIGKSLRELSDSMRISRRQLAEERAQKTAVKLVFPLVLFIFPGIFVVLVGPAAILMIKDMLN